MLFLPFPTAGPSDFYDKKQKKLVEIYAWQKS